MPLREYVQHNFWLKFFSLLLATLIWFAIRPGETPKNQFLRPLKEEVMRLPVRVLTNPGDTRVFKMEPERVLVKIQGEEALLREITPKNSWAFVDLTNTRSTRETNQQVKINIPPGVTIVEILPLTVDVEQVVESSD